VKKFYFHRLPVPRKRSWSW